MGLSSIHRTVSTDGTAIVGHVAGAGPPLLLIHGEPVRVCRSARYVTAASLARSRVPSSMSTKRSVTTPQEDVPRALPRCFGHVATELARFGRKLVVEENGGSRRSPDAEVATQAMSGVRIRQAAESNGK